MTRSIFGRAFAWLATAYRQRQAIHQLSKLGDHHLRDIGIEPNGIRDAVRGHNLPVDMPVSDRGGARRAIFPRPCADAAPGKGVPGLST